MTLSRDTRRPLYEIQGLVSFYPHFRSEPPPQVALHVCHDLTCWLRGGDDRIAALREQYGDGAPDGADVELVEVSCLGRCDTAPAVAVNDVPGHVDDVESLVARARTAHRRAGARRPAGRPARDAVAQRPVRARTSSVTGCCGPCSPATSTPARWCRP